MNLMACHIAANLDDSNFGFSLPSTMSMEHVSSAVFPALAKRTILAANETAVVDEDRRRWKVQKKKNLLVYCKKSRVMRSVE